MEDQRIDIEALAKLARLEISAEETAALESEIPPILAFVETVQKVSAEAPKAAPSLRNVMRDDAAAHEGGVHTKGLLEAAPAQKDDQIVVKQVISRKK